MHLKLKEDILKQDFNIGSHVNFYYVLLPQTLTYILGQNYSFPHHSLCNSYYKSLFSSYLSGSPYLYLFSSLAEDAYFNQFLQVSPYGFPSISVKDA